MRFVHVKEKDFKGPELELIPIGDIHYGSKECNIKKIKENVQYVKDNKNARVVLMGDLVDIALRDSVGAGTFDNNFEPEEQIDGIIELLMPIKNKILCLIGGNHEERIRMRTSIDINKLIAKALDTTYVGSMCFLKIMVGTTNYVVFAAHGSTGAVSPAGKINAVMKYGTYIDADLYLMGHVHELAHHTTEYFRVDIGNKQIVKDKRHYVITGHYLNYGGYAEAKGYAPGKTGSPNIKLSKDIKRIRVSI